MKEGMQADFEVKKMEVLLASSLILMSKCFRYCWNMTGVELLVVRDLFKKFRKELHYATNTIAERICILGSKININVIHNAEISVVKDDVNDASLNLETMINNLAHDNEKLLLFIKEMLNRLDKDSTSINILKKRKEIHEKNIWTLKTISSGSDADVNSNVFIS